MSRLSIFTLLSLIALIAAFGGLAGAQSDDLAQIRLVHASADTPAIDIKIGDTAIATDLTFSQATGYFLLPPGEHAFAIGGQDLPAPITETLTLEAGQSLTAVLTGPSDAPKLQTFRDDRSPLPLGTGRLVLINAAQEIETISIQTGDGSTLVSGVTQGKPAPPIELPAGTYDLTLTDQADTALPGSRTTEVHTGTLYTLMVLDGGSVTLTAPVKAAEPANAAWLRMAHASPDAPKVDVYLDEVKVFAGLGFGQASEAVPIPASEYAVTVYETGADPATASRLIGVQFAITAGDSRVLMAMGKAASLELVTFIEDQTPPTAGTARLSVIHAAPDVPDVKLTLDDANNTVLVDTLTFGGQSPGIELMPDMYGASAANAATGEDLLKLSRTQLDAGRGYTAVMVAPSQGTQIVMPLTFSQPLAVLAPSTAAADAAPAESPENTPTAESLDAASSSAPTAAPTAIPTVTTAAADAAQPAEGAITGKIITSPGVYLNVRYEPNLDRPPQPIPGLPSGAEIRVLGRDETGEWLYVNWNSPDQGLVEGWVASYLVAVTMNGQKLAPADITKLPLAFGTGTPSGQPVATVATTAQPANTLEPGATPAPTAEGGETGAAPGQAAMSISNFYYGDNNKAYLDLTVTNISVQPAVASGSFFPLDNPDGGRQWVTLLKADFTTPGDIPYPLVWEPNHGRAPLWELIVHTSDGITFPSYAGCEYHQKIVAEGFEPTAEGGFHWTQVLEDGWFQCGRERDPAPKPMDNLEPGESATVPVQILLKNPLDTSGDVRTITQIDVALYKPDGTSIGVVGTWRP